MSDARDAKADLAAIPPPATKAEMRLPFAKGQVWRVTQGFNDPTVSHRGYAAFCLDLVRVDPPETKLAPFCATAAGQVAFKHVHVEGQPVALELRRLQHHDRVADFRPVRAEHRDGGVRRILGKTLIALIVWRPFLQQVGRDAIDSPQAAVDKLAEAKKAGKPVLMKVYREGMTRFVAISPRAA